jgi:hypothetical protein
VNQRKDTAGFSLLLRIAFDIVKPALRVIRFLLLLMLPVSFAVMVLETSGVMQYVALFTDPLMRFLGLPGEASLAFISAILINIYSAIAVIETIALDGRQLVILSTMCLIAHNFFVECVVMKRTGSRLFRMVFLRIFIAVLAAWLMNMFIKPGDLPVPVEKSAVALRPGYGVAVFYARLLPWFIDSLFLMLQIFLIVFAVMFVQQVLRECGMMRKLGRITSPLLSMLGLPAETGYAWIVAETVGVAYGSGILIEEVKSGKLSRPDADLINHFAAISHSQIEDTLLFVSIGVPYVWAALPRFFLAIIVVWAERARRAVFRRSFRVRVQQGLR